MKFSARLKNWQQKPLQEKLNSFRYNYKAAKLSLIMKLGKPEQLIASLPWGKMVVNTDWLGKNIYFGSYERKELMSLAGIIKPGSIALDIGANIGYYSVFLSRAVKCARVLAFEPSPRELNQLQQNLEMNNCSNVEVFQIALGDKHSSIELYLSDSNFGRNSINEFATSNKHITVEMIPLDNFLEGKQIASIDIIKLDVEGAEPLVLKGASATIARHKPVILYESWEFNKAPLGSFDCEATRIIQSHGYFLFDIDVAGKLIRVNEGDRILSENVIAIHRERIDAFSHRITKRN